MLTYDIILLYLFVMLTYDINLLHYVAIVFA